MDRRLAPPGRPLRSVFAVVGLVAALVLAGCAESTPKLSVSDAYIPVPMNPDVAALYFTISNAGAEDVLTGVSTPISDMAHMHRSSVNDDGTASMEPIDEVAIDDGSALAFKPGSYHVMIMEPGELSDGDTVPVTLSFKTSASITVDAKIVESLPEAAADE